MCENDAKPCAINSFACKNTCQNFRSFAVELATVFRSSSGRFSIRSNPILDAFSGVQGNFVGQPG